MGTIARAAFVLSPVGVNNEGFPSSSFANGPSTEPASKGSKAIIDNNHLHFNPYPNTYGPGQGPACEAGNESYLVGKAQLNNLPAASIGKNRELTGRSQNLFGETYPAAQLQALGLQKAEAKKPAKKPAKKGKKK